MAVGAEALRRASKQVVPLDFGEPERLHQALVEGGFEDVRVRVVELASRETVTDFVAFRELTSAGRFGRHALGPARWDGFRAEMVDALRARVGERFSTSRSVVLAAGTKDG